MVSNVSLYPFDPGRDADVAYEPATTARPAGGTHPRGRRVFAGQIAFDAPWVSIPGTLNRYTRISLEELESEMERSARRDEH
jgi:hypothetical protein